MSSLQIVLIAALVVPALALALWPLLSGRGRAERRTGGPAGSEKHLELAEEKASIYRALKELDFDYEAGHLSEDDYRALRSRYESRAAEILKALDALQPVPARPEPTRAPAPATAEKAGRGWTRHPATFAAGAVLLLVFGVVVGLGVSRFTEVDRAAMAPSATPGMPGMSGPMPPGGGAPMGPATVGLDPGQPIPPEVLAGMLRAARESLFAGQYQQAIPAYQAVLKRDPKNLDAMTHLALIVAIGGHADSALETFNKALQIDPNYPPAYLYRGQVLYEVKQDYAGAVRAWERFMALVPSGEEHDRVVALVKEARSKQPAR